MRFGLLRVLKNSVHPHARGDDVPLRFVRPASDGSPPRAWGRYDAPVKFLVGLRFTPTRVGTIRRLRPCSAPSPVHPHARGDDNGETCPGEAKCGSPPRAWGRFAVLEDTGFFDTVHPHARGDDVAEVAPGGDARGSPPRAWGRLLDLGVPRDDDRFTPTRVGTIASPVVSSAATPVHPHARGDDAFFEPFFAPAPGSPPRAWGRSAGRFPRRDVRGFTPTRVGTIGRPAPSRRRTAVHPHARGDDTGEVPAEALASGSPPRAWGR